MSTDIALNAALREADGGCPVFPIRQPVGGGICSCKNGATCRVPGKHPWLRDWPELATADYDQIMRWAQEFPCCNWGGLTAERAGRFIIEIDPRNGGDKTLARLEAGRLGPLPETRTYQASAGGKHLIFKWPAGSHITNAAGMIGNIPAPGVDVRGHHGMGLLPGSLHKSGIRYQLVDDLEPAELPATWAAALTTEAPRLKPERVYDGPKANFESVMAECAFMQHVRDDAATLGESDWWMGISIAANTEGGIEHAHELSRPYPGYTFDETQAKAVRAFDENKPHTCDAIAGRTGGRWCHECKHRGKIRSPLNLGFPRIGEDWRDARSNAPSDDANDADDDDSESPPSARSQATKLARLMIDGDADLFHDANRTAYATVTVGSHRETWPVESKSFRDYLASAYYRKYQSAPGAKGMADAITQLAGRAVFDADQREVALRTAGRDFTLYIDLGDEQWRVVRVNGDGWEVVSPSPVCFRRSSSTRPLPEPVPGGSIDLLARYVNLHGGAAGDDFLLFVGAILASLRPTGPYPIVDLTGEQGGGKTTAARVMRRLVDNRKVEITSMPRDDRDLASVAANGHLLVFDNISTISEDRADALCRLSTGGGWQSRKLYSDDEEHAIEATRPIVLTGIPDLATRPDLADRTITIEIPGIERARRKTEQAFWTDFDQDAPQIFGALLTILKTAIRNLDAVQHDDLPRMADFARLGEAMLPAFGRDPGDFVTAIRRNQNRQNSIILEAHPEANELMRWMNNRTDHRATDTASNILAMLNEWAPKSISRSSSWPKSPKDLSVNLRRLAPNLKQAGYEITFSRDSKTRLITIERRTMGETNRESASSASSASQGARSDDANDGNDADSPIVSPTHQQPSANGFHGWMCDCGAENTMTAMRCKQCNVSRFQEVTS